MWRGRASCDIGDVTQVGENDGKDADKMENNGGSSATCHIDGLVILLMQD